MQAEAEAKEAARALTRAVAVKKQFTDELDPFPGAEAVMLRLRKVVQRIDVNHDGSISREECVAFIKGLGAPEENAIIEAEGMIQPQGMAVEQFINTVKGFFCDATAWDGAGRRLEAMEGTRSAEGVGSKTTTPDPPPAPAVSHHEAVTTAQDAAAVQLLRSRQTEAALLARIAELEATVCRLQEEATARGPSNEQAQAVAAKESMTSYQQALPPYTQPSQPCL